MQSAGRGFKFSESSGPAGSFPPAFKAPDGTVAAYFEATAVNTVLVLLGHGSLQVERGSGEFLRCERPDFARPRGSLIPEIDPDKNFGAELSI